MQNLTLQLAQANPVKKVADFEGKSNQGAGNAKENDQMFASILKKQVNQKENNNKQAANAASANQQAETAAKNASKAKQSKDTDAAKQETIDDESATDAKVAIETTADSKAKTSDIATDSRQEISDAQSSQDTLIAQMGLPAMLHQGQKSQGVDDLKATNDIATVDSTEGIDIKGARDEGQSTIIGSSARDEKGDAKEDSLALPVKDRLASANTTESNKSVATDDKAEVKKSGPMVKRDDLTQAHIKGTDADARVAERKEIVPTSQFARPEANISTQQANATVASQAMAKTDQIATYFGKPEWNQAVNQKIVWMVGAGDHSATLNLNPPDLGPLQVVLKVGNDHVDTTFISDNPEVRQALQDGMHMLRDKMHESGLQLGNTSISANLQSQRDFQQAAQHRTQHDTGSSSEGVSNRVADNSEAMPKVIRQQVSDGLVDTFA